MSNKAKAKEHFSTAVDLLSRLRVALESKRAVTDADLRLVQGHVISGLDAMNGVRRAGRGGSKKEP